MDLDCSAELRHQAADSGFARPGREGEVTLDQESVDLDLTPTYARWARALLCQRSDQVVFCLKFPLSYKIEFPRCIGNYNPDWGIARHGEDGRVILELVRETKGTTQLDALQFPHEKRKVECARRHFAAVGIDYRVVSGQTVEWWRAEAPGEQMGF